MADRTPPRSAFWSPIVRQRISRRRALAGACAVSGAAAAFAAVGCDNDESSPVAESPQPGGVLRFGSTLPPSFGLDPHVETGGALPMIARLYGYPHHADPSSDDILLDHVESYEQPDDAIYVLRMRQDVRFHDLPPANGRVVTADDVVLSMRRYRDSALTVNKYWHTKILIGEGATDPRTVFVATAAPYVYSMAEMGGINAGAIIPREAVDQSLEIRSSVAGSGPLQLVAALPVPPDLQRSSIALQRFDAYSREPSYVGGMEWRYFDDATAMADTLREKAIDLMPATSAAEADELRNELDGVTATPEPSLSSLTLALRVDQPPFADERVRRALDLLVDRAALIEERPDARLCGPVNPNLAGGFWSLTDDEIKQSQGAGSVSERRAEAMALLSAAGASSLSFELQVAQVPELIDVASAISSQLASAGVAATVRSNPILAWYVRSRRGDFTSSLIAHAPYETPDGALRWHRSDGPDGNGNPMHFSSADVDGAIDRVRAEPDRNARRESVLDVQRQIMDQRAMLHLFTSAGYVVAWDYVQDAGLELPGSLARYHYRQWLALPVDGRPD